MLELQKTQYDMKTLIKHIYELDIIQILKTQKIDAEFTINYVLNKDYQFTEKEEAITMEDVLKLQPHLKREDLEKIKKLHPPLNGPFFS
jgi:hypothetical protein